MTMKSTLPCDCVRSSRFVGAQPRLSRLVTFSWYWAVPPGVMSAAAGVRLMPIGRAVHFLAYATWGAVYPAGASVAWARRPIFCRRFGPVDLLEEMRGALDGLGAHLDGRAVDIEMSRVRV